MKEYKLICPNCGTVYNSNSRAKQACVKCGVGVVYSGFTKDEYDRKSVEEQRGIINSVRNGKISGNPIDAENDSFWIRFVNIIIDIFIFIGILGSIIGGIVVMFANVVLGIIVIILGVFITLLSVSLTKILIGAASDLNYIRNYLQTKN